MDSNNLLSVAQYISAEELGQILVANKDLSRCSNYFRTECREYFNEIWNKHVPHLNKDLIRLLNIAYYDIKIRFAQTRSHYLYGFRKCIELIQWIVIRLHPYEISPEAISMLYEILEVLEADLDLDSRYNYGKRATKYTIYVAKQKRNIRPSFVAIPKEKSTEQTLLEIKRLVGKDNLYSSVFQKLENLKPTDSETLWDCITVEQNKPRLWYRSIFQGLLSKLFEGLKVKYN